MGYPYDKTYLEKIQENNECNDIRTAFHILTSQYCEEHQTDTVAMGVDEYFAVLGKAFKYASDTLEGVSDTYHFMWDVLDALLPEKSHKQ